MLAELKADLDDGQLMARSTHIATGRVQLALITSPQAMGDDSTWLINNFSPEYRMPPHGAGQLAEYLAMSRAATGRHPIFG